MAPGSGSARNLDLSPRNVPIVFASLWLMEGVGLALGETLPGPGEVEHDIRCKC